MSVETSNKILKITGIATIVISIFVIIIGVLSILGSNLISVDAAAEQKLDKDLALGVMVFSLLGMMALFSGILNLLEGIFSVRAANDNTKIMPAWIFAIINLVMGVINIITVVMDQSLENKGSTIVGTIIGLVITILIFYAANTIKQAQNNNTIKQN
ncbi:MAG: hypothetical protein IJ593_08470 [Lachnospiraceae bacterium]|nr:hypothetical protein [Lachnospiraceae bacterium]